MVDRVKQLVVVEQARQYRTSPSERVALFNPDRTPYSAPPPAGTPVVRKFPFAFDTPDLLTGAELYTPTVGDILLDAWLEIVEVWDGTTPKADIGLFNGPPEETFGLFGVAGGSSATLDLTLPEQEDPGNAGYLVSFSASDLAGSSANNSVRVAPGKFTTTDPIKVIATTNGRLDGEDPESTEGSAILYLVTVTPA